MDQAQPSFLIQLLPLIFMTVMYGTALLVICLWLAPRKGLSPWYGLIGFVPCVGVFFLIYLLSRTDQTVLDQLADLQRRLSEPRRQGPPPIL